jgi:predicted ATPase/Tfp pilus assembly protein PilF/DNA-binding SARP family transcriptional activator
MQHLRLKTLGGLALEGSAFSRAKPLLLLAYLALEGPASRRELAELFFMRTKNPPDSLSTALRYLRYESPELLELSGDRVEARLLCDAVELLRLLYTGELEEAVVCYEGSFAKGIDLALDAELEEWVYGTREFLAGRTREAHLRLGERLASQGRFEAAARHAEAAYTLAGAREPEPEVFSRIYTLLCIGNSPRAAEVKREAKAFAIDLTVDLEEARTRLLQEEESPPRHNLPAPTDAFIGRDPELVELADLLAEPHSRLLTLHGAGGVGKSRLALQAAHDQLGEGRFHDGIFFIGLDALTSAEQIPLSLAEALGLSLQGNDEPLTQVEAYLKDRRLLLVLDNYEQLIEAATLPADLLAACPHLKIIVTSRERLNLREEHVLTLEGLPLAEEDATLEEAQYVEAVQLLLQRAKKARLDFGLTQETLPHALKICRLVEGYPLGIELAAAWARALPLADIAGEIERNLDFLDSSSRNIARRHQSIRAAFEQSWRLLTPKEQEVLKKLAVFRGGFRREAAREVVGASLPLLASLVDKSLLRVLPSGRYHRHALLYGYIQEKLLAEPRLHDETKDKHAAYFLALAEEAEPQLLGSEQKVWLERLEEELDNLRSALEWTEASGQIEVGLRLAGALWRFWLTRGYADEGRERLQKAIAQSAELTAARAKALHGAGNLTTYLGDYAAARALHEESLTIRRALGDKRGIADALHNLGAIAHYQGDYARARALYEESLSLRRELDDKHGIALSVNNLGLIAYYQGDFVTARTLYEESLEIDRELGDKQGIAFSLHNLGLVAHDQGDFATAHALYEESLLLRRELGDKQGVAFSLSNLGAIAHDQGDFATARALYEESLAIKRELGNKQGIALTLHDLGVTAHVQGDYATARALYKESLTLRRELEDKRGTATSLEELGSLIAVEGEPAHAALLWGAAEALREAIGAPRSPFEQPRYEGAVAAARAGLDAAAFAARWEEGRAMTLENAIAYALGEAVPERKPPTSRPFQAG